MILFVSYDLKSNRDYTPLYEALKRQGTWWHYLASTWLLSTSKAPNEVAEAVHPYMDAHDFLFVAEMGSRYQGYLPQQAWEWISTQTSQSQFLTLYGIQSPSDNIFATKPINSYAPPQNPFIAPPTMPEVPPENRFTLGSTNPFAPPPKATEKKER